MASTPAAAAALVPRSAVRRRAWQAGPVAGLVCVALLLAALAETVGLSRAGSIAGALCAVILNGALARGLSGYRYYRLALADRVTLGRATLAIGVAALTVDSFYRRTPVATLVALAAVALALDSVDGWVARRTGKTETLGGLFDGEVDAFLILVLSVYVARLAGVWVLAIGAARYAFLAAGWALPWMRERLPPRYWRKVVTATGGIVLTVAAADVLPRPVAQAALAGALLLLAESFGRDVWWLWAHRRPSPAVAAIAGRKRGPLRAALGVALTALALIIVWIALVAPDQPHALTPAALIRVPLEGLVLVGLAALLPATARRVVAAVIGPALGLFVILKVLDFGFFTLFDRPFDPLGDARQAATGMETLRDAIGRTDANLAVIGAVALAVVVLALSTLAVIRVLRVAADNRRWSLRAVAGLGGVWLLCLLFGAQLVSHTPIASTSAATLVLDKVHTVQADIHDEGVFANQIRHDRFRDTPGDQLLSALRGKDVLLTFVESYGQVTVQGSSFSPAVDALLDRGTGQLKSAGFSARSAFLTSPTFGGVSWLAHSTLQSGVWANSQQRYDQLVATHRLTLSDAFKRAGWRTVDDSPADDRAWPQGTSFYHYDKVYDRRDVGYHGPTYNYAPMPDQYLFSSFERLELAKQKRPPVFAELDTVSSHMPWDRIPQMVPWNQIGDGSIFNRTPTFKEPDSFWWSPKRVQAAYARSIKYSLITLISFVQHYGNKNLVLIVVGDEQPLANVSGQGANHNVPVSIISRDQTVLRHIGGWGWDAGLLPGKHAPDWAMSALRDRFLTAFR
jgi:phosphatidylglycerophosphate synthase